MALQVKVTGCEDLRSLVKKCIIQENCAQNGTLCLGVVREALLKGCVSFHRLARIMHRSAAAAPLSERNETILRPDCSRPEAPPTFERSPRRTSQYAFGAFLWRALSGRCFYRFVTRIYAKSGLRISINREKGDSEMEVRKCFSLS